MATGYGEDVPLGPGLAGVPVVSKPYTSKTLAAKIVTALAAKKD